MFTAFTADDETCGEKEPEDELPEEDPVADDGADAPLADGMLFKSELPLESGPIDALPEPVDGEMTGAEAGSVDPDDVD